MDRPVRLIAVAVIAALVGGLAGALVVRTSTSGHDQTVIVDASPPTDTGEGRLASAPISRSRFDPARIYSRRAAGVVTLYSYFGSYDATEPHAVQGSGFVVSKTGAILTNAHVITTAPSASIHAAKSVIVEFQDGDRASARVVGYDLFSDVGVVKVDPGAHRLVPVPLGDSSRVFVGEPVAAIGSPFGRQDSLTVGVVSAVGRSIASLTSDYDLANAIQTDAPINRGNSGGPLFDSTGRAVGINAQIRSDSGINEGVGFAVPIDAARRSLRELLRSGHVDYAYVGVSTQDLTPAVARRLGYAAGYGALVECVAAGGPADTAGLHAGTGQRSLLGRLGVVEGSDVIVAIDRHPVRSGSDLVRVVSEQLRPGRAAVFTVVRGQARRRVVVKPVERPRLPSTSCRR